MNASTKLVAILPLTAAMAGCTSYVTQQQGKPWPGSYQDCPRLYTLTRMELSSLAWAFSGDMVPADRCLAHYYAKAHRDSFYRDVNRYLIPGYLLSLPADVMLDSFTLPFAAW